MKYLSSNRQALLDAAEMIDNGDEGTALAERLRDVAARMSHSLVRRAEKRMQTCTVCGVRVFDEPVMLDYMVEDVVWATAGFDPRDLACLGCFEKRLGRDIALADLTDAVVNRSVQWMLRNNHAPWRRPRLWED